MSYRSRLTRPAHRVKITRANGPVFQENRRKVLKGRHILVPCTRSCKSLSGLR